MIKTLATSMLAAAALALCVTGSASAQGMVPDQRTFFTFSAPVQLPGVTLPAGKYTFRLADSMANRHIVQVFNADGTKIITTLFAVAAERNSVPENAEIQFLESPANAPTAIDVWWYPGTKTGHEFIYPKDSSTRYAKAKGGAEKFAKGEPAPSSMVFVPGAKVDIERPAVATAPADVKARAEAPAPVASSVRPAASVANSFASLTSRVIRPVSMSRA